MTDTKHRVDTASVPIDTGEFTRYMADSVPLSQPVPTVEPAVDSADLPTGSTDGDAPAPSDHVHTDYTPDYAALDAARGNPEVWARELYELLGHTTGTWFDQGTIEAWLAALAQQAQRQAFRAAAFQVANTTLPPDAQGDPSFLLLQLREDITSMLKRSAQ